MAKRSEFASLRFAEKISVFAFASLRFLIRKKIRFRFAFAIGFRPKFEALAGVVLLRNRQQAYTLKADE